MKRGILSNACLVFLLLAVVESAYSEGGWYVNKDVAGYLFEDGRMIGLSSVLLRRGQHLNCDLREDKCCFEEQEGTICLDMKNLSRDVVPLYDSSILAIKYDLNGNSDPCGGRSLDDAVTDAFISSYGVLVDGNNRPLLLSLAFYVNKNGMRLGYPTINKGIVVSGSDTCYSIGIAREELALFMDKYHEVAEVLGVEIDLNIPVIAELQVLPVGLDADFSNNLMSWETKLPADNVSSWPRTAN